VVRGLSVHRITACVNVARVHSHGWHWARISVSGVSGGRIDNEGVETAGIVCHHGLGWSVGLQHDALISSSRNGAWLVVVSVGCGLLEAVVAQLACVVVKALLTLATGRAGHVEVERLRRFSQNRQLFAKKELYI
jgi:hypothetical protein